MENTNTIYDETYSTVLDLKTANKVVFRAFIQYLCKHNDLVLSPEKFNIWLTRRMNNIKNTTNTRFNDLRDMIIISDEKPIGTLKSIRYLTVNSVTGLESDICMSQYYDCPVSAILFSNSYSGNAYITKDWNYNRCLDNDPVEYKRIYGRFETPRNFDYAYWENNYSFSDHFDYDEYQQYNIQVCYGLEAKSVFSASDCTYNIVKSPTKAEGLLITFNDNENIPVAYWDLHNAIRTMDGKIEIDFSSYGIMSIDNETTLIE